MDIKIQNKIVKYIENIEKKLCAILKNSTPNQVILNSRESVTIDGSIPAGATSYNIINLGPTGDGTGLLSFTFDGDTIPAVLQSISGSVDKGNTFPELLYVVNGNILYVEYTTVA